MQSKKIKFKIIYCFLDNEKAVQTDEYGEELYYSEIVESDNTQEAINIFKGMEQFKKCTPEIIMAVEEGGNV